MYLHSKVPDMPSEMTCLETSKYLVLDPSKPSKSVISGVPEVLRYLEIHDFRGTPDPEILGIPPNRWFPGYLSRVSQIHRSWDPLISRPQDPKYTYLDPSEPI